MKDMLTRETINKVFKTEDEKWKALEQLLEKHVIGDTPKRTSSNLIFMFWCPHCNNKIRTEHCFEKNGKILVTRASGKRSNFCSECGLKLNWDDIE